MRNLILTCGALALFVAPDLPLTAQYPPGGYPPGGGYPGSGVGLPRIPRIGKKKKTTAKDDEQQQLQDVSGMLRQMDAKTIVLEAQDTRILNLKRSDKIKFLKNGEDIKSEIL